ncbi:MAG: GDP-mannose 4,6-dehydratase [Phycisphaeraceae bacterium]|nr:GDP-mannose 4,6-dehydratase [Phycisphaeraceae bacterium]
MRDRPTLITGVAGFIGSHTAEALLRSGRRVVGIDNFDPFYPERLKRLNLAEVEATAAKHDAGFEFIPCDITNQNEVAFLFERTNPGAIIHLAAKAGVRPSIADPAGYARVNVTGTSILLDQCAKHNLERVVIASSSSVYGTLAPGEKSRPFREDENVDRPISPYAATKRACELIGYTHHHLTKQPVAMLRFFTVFGPRQRPDLAIRSFMSKIASGEQLTLFGDGTSSRDYTFVADTVGGILSALDRIPTFGYRIWNLGNSKPIKLDEMVDAIAKAVGKPAKIARAPMQAGDVLATWADPKRSREELGYEPKTSFEQGLARQWEWMQRNKAETK